MRMIDIDRHLLPSCQAIVPLCLLLAMAGCDPAGGGSGSGGGGGGGIAELFGGASQSSRETWTIECSEFEGGQRNETADRLATMLKQVQGINPRLVSVRHEDTVSRVFYGEYQLRYKEAKTDGDNKSRGDLVIEISDELKRDLRFVRGLAVGDQYPFFTARPVAKLEPFTGNPAWDLRNASGIYTLNVGVTYNTPTMHRGYEAYYYFAPDHAQASICVGTFNEDAFVFDRGGRKGYSPKVKALQAKEDFQYNLENGHPMYKSKKNPDGGKVERVPNYSFLAKIPKREDLRTGR
ncbi:MAG: hypothetical protein IPK83_14375 [Planctomycetes bacterium]|nr:hypothetical protein [Planctomycetota bacterium]